MYNSVHRVPVLFVDTVVVLFEEPLLLLLLLLPPPDDWVALIISGTVI